MKTSKASVRHNFIVQTLLLQPSWVLLKTTLSLQLLAPTLLILKSIHNSTELHPQFWAPPKTKLSHTHNNINQQYNNTDSH